MSKKLRDLLPILAVFGFLMTALIVTLVHFSTAAPNVQPPLVQETVEGREILFAAGLLSGLCSSTVDHLVTNNHEFFIGRPLFTGEVRVFDCISQDKDIDVMLEECDSSGLNCNDMLGSDLNCSTTGGTVNVGEFTDPNFDVEDRLKVSFVVSGGPADSITVTTCWVPSI